MSFYNQILYFFSADPGLFPALLLSSPEEFSDSITPSSGLFTNSAYAWWNYRRIYVDLISFSEIIVERIFKMVRNGF
jgi:hypothetical protein